MGTFKSSGWEKCSPWNMPFLCISEKNENVIHLMMTVACRLCICMHVKCFWFWSIKDKNESMRCLYNLTLIYKFYFLPPNNYESFSTICDDFFFKRTLIEINCSHLVISGSTLRMHFLLKVAFSGLCLCLLECPQASFISEKINGKGLRPVLKEINRSEYDC